MDPNTTLYTFMLRTPPSVKTVNLIGSWDNFTRGYTMERDSRRDRGQWKGCYAFKDITCEGDAGSVPKRNGGLKMGHTYYYYYELDGACETHDPSQPSTNTCPYLPGQTVNTLYIPVEQSGRKRSASMTSLNEADFKTMDPTSKFVTPRPAPTPPEPVRRLGSAPLWMQQHQKRPSRSPSPSSRWHFSTARKLFSRKPSSCSLRDVITQAPQAEDERSLRSEGNRSRDMSPESLRRFLVDDAAPAEAEHEDNSRPAIDIPEDIAEENEDDDNFATSAVSETMPFTGLSPPPPRSLSPAGSTISTLNKKKEEAVPPGAQNSHTAVPSAPTRQPPLLPTISTARAYVPHPGEFPLSALACQPFPDSPDSGSPPGFCLSEAEEEEEEEEDLDVDMDMDMAEKGRDGALASSTAGAVGHPKSPLVARNIAATLSTYSLPRTAGTDAGKLVAAVGGTGSTGTGTGTGDATTTTTNIPPVSSNDERLASSTAADAVSGPLLLTSPIPDAGLEDLVTELGWMVETIGRF
ncbi:hypothetical protein MYCTH_2079474 [Thermothelomyces thermophilus ATCC 42464]|uniref:Uncharacterized protein n=1 Tax=Thermothelomyces thermophilus (strain ATCC 42464 / BCRC 31852 / DSM 1799) TaxID=573729 RepID=G2QDS6_THET4|nr:uncharacterized protein MYCTH_2079474 [Thermothelomyces thermophilus ATCC 42464]AEO57535.1 hypothetical protein MYCTH_2079474 [Thermothelomyces thermophilus ATCC 42464]